MTTRSWTTRLIAAALAAAALGGTARAGLVPSSVTVTPDAGNFRWTYAVVLPTDMKLQSGSYFTVYDFGGLVAGSISAPDGWAVSTGNAGPVPTGLHPSDDPNQINLTFTYNGPTIPTGQLGLGNFWADSTLSTSVQTEFTAQNPQASTGNLDRNLVETISPGTPGSTGGGDTGGGGGTVSGVPEPTTLALAGLGLPALGAIRLTRRRR